MGCDIHMVLERRKAPTRKWVGVWSSDGAPGGRPTVARRDYSFFAQVAGVRGHANRELPSSYPKNIPEDVSALAWEEYMSAPIDHHSASHLPLAEFIAIYLAINPSANPCSAEYHLFGACDEGEYRVVFWFDN